MLRLIGLFILLASAPAQADGWETFSHDMGNGAAVCPYDDAESGRFFCFALACPPGGGAPMIRVTFSGSAIGQPSAPLSVRVDGKIVSRLFLTRLREPDGEGDYGTPVDPVRDAALIEALKTGRRATIVFGIGLQAVVEPISLSGSHAALDAVPDLCGAVLLAAPQDD